MTIALPILIPIAAAAGAVIGVGADHASVSMVKKRSDEASVPVAWYLNRRYSVIIWALLFAVAYGGAAALFGGELEKTLHFAILFFCCACICAVDAKVRKVPNPILILMFLNTAVFTALSYPDMELGSRFIALVIAAVVFSVPSYFKLYVGAGDVKLAIVVALDLALLGFLQAMIVMGLCFLIAALYLIISKKGGLKTKLPMGPFIALGTVLAAFFPLI